MVSFVGVRGEGGTFIIVKSSTKQYPTILNYSFEMQHLKSDPKPASLRLFISGVLTMSQMLGAGQFRCHKHWWGRGGSWGWPIYFLRIWWDSFLI